MSNQENHEPLDVIVDITIPVYLDRDLFLIEPTEDELEEFLVSTTAKQAYLEVKVENQEVGTWVPVALDTLREMHKWGTIMSIRRKPLNTTVLQVFVLGTDAEINKARYKLETKKDAA